MCIRDRHEAELVIFEAARSTLLAMPGDEKLPSLQTLQAEQAQLFEEQERLYAERNRFKIQTMMLLGMTKQTSKNVNHRRVHLNMLISVCLLYTSRCV